MFSNNHSKSGTRGVRLNLLAAALLSCTGVSGAHAQSSNSAILEEIIVTARRTEENLQSVPVTVTAISGEQLKNQGINRPADLQFAAPSVAVGPGLGRLSGSYTVRGLDAGVVTYFNEVPGGPSQVGMPFFDTQSVQVLNGPQGTLFGRTGAAGAVLITTNSPDLESTGGYIDVATGNYGRLEGTGVFNLPVIPGQLGLRVAYHHEELDGFTKQLGGGQALDSVENDSIRASLKWQGDKFSNSLVGNYLNIDDTAAGWILSAANPNLGLLNTPPAFAPFVFGGICGLAVTNGLESSVSACVADRYAITQDIKAALIAENERIQNGGDSAVRYTPALDGFSGDREYRHFSVMDIAEYDFGEIGPTTLSVKNIFSYQEDSEATSYALDGLGGRLLAVAGSGGVGAASTQQIGNTVDPNRGKPTKLYTEELQFKGLAADAIDWTLGVYYQKSKTQKDLAGVRSMYRTLSGLFTQNLGWGKGYEFSAGSEATEFAGYGQVTIDLNAIGLSGTKLTGGYRYTRSETDSKTILALSNPSGTGPLIPATGTDALQTTSIKSDGTNYTVSLTHEVTPDVLVYASTSKSFVPGGVNAVVGCELVPNCEPTFDPETVKNYELGFKSEFDLGETAFRLNADIYRMDFDNIQRPAQFTSGSVSVAYQQNVAEARMEGFETHLDIVSRNGISLTLNYSYLDAEFLDWVAADPNLIILPTDDCLEGSDPDNNFCLIDLSDNPFQKAPKHQVNATLRYLLPLPQEYGDMSVSVTGYYQTRQWNAISSTRQLEVAESLGLTDFDRESISQPSYSKFNARIDWTNVMTSNLSLGLFVNNLTDETYSQAGGSNLLTLGTAFKLYAEPRMWGMNISYRFGE